MFFVSDLIGKAVVDADGRRIGKVHDVLASAHGTHPDSQISALVVRTGDRELTLSLADVLVLVGPAVVLAKAMQDVSAHDAGDALWLARDVLDKEIVDTDGARVVRVNDIELARANGRITSVHIGGLAILRRLGLEGLAQRVARLAGRSITPSRVSWDDVDLLPGAPHARLRFSAKTADLPAADLAEIISDLSRVESTQVVESLDVETLAETLEEVEPDFQASLVQSLTDEKVADVLEEMAPDEAADLLAELPEERSQSLLDLMDSAEATEVRRLLTYAEDTVGGLMTTEVITVRPDLTVSQTMAHLRTTAQESENIYYIYVTDEQGRLLGVCSLQQIVLADPETLLSQIMHDRLVDIKPDDSQDDVAQLVAKYNLLAVPVVDDENRLLGIVTADDALDKVLPETWKRHVPRLFG
jgi:CBS domain-containing protein